MKRNLWIYSLMLFPIASFGQYDALRHEYLNQNASRKEIIQKGRKLILENFKKGDLREVHELKDFLISDVENEEYTAFHPAEYWLILYWTREYKDLLKSIHGLDSTENLDSQKKRTPQYDLLFETVQERSRELTTQLESQIQSADLASVEKDFLLLFLKHILTDPDHPEITRESLNSMAGDFLIRYPGSAYDHIVRAYIRYKYVPSNWSFAFELFSGYGLFTKNLKHHYENNIPIGVAVDVNFKKFSLYLRNYIGRSKTKLDIPYDSGTWEKGSEVEVFLAEASLGYMIFENKILKISPFAGISSTNIGPILYDLEMEPELEKVELKFTTTYSVGMNGDLKLGQSRDPALASRTKQRYWFIRLRYAYNMPQFKREYDGFNGSMHYLTAGIGRLSRKIHRVY